MCEMTDTEIDRIAEREATCLLQKIGDAPILADYENWTESELLAELERRKLNHNVNVKTWPLLESRLARLGAILKRDNPSRLAVLLATNRNR